MEKPRVVLIEDDDVIADFIIKRLELEGMEPIRYSNGLDGVSGIVRSDRVDLILLDISLPDIDGFEVMRRLAPFQKTANIPVVIVSNFSQESDIAWGKKLGAIFFINKASATPIEIVEIASKVISGNKKHQNPTAPSVSEGTQA